MFPDMTLEERPADRVFASPEQQKIASIWAELLGI